MAHKFYVYILRSLKDGSIYIGLTANLRRRLREHSGGLSSYTRKKLPWELVWYCVFGDRERAERFERYLKSGSGRAFIRKRIV